MQNLLVGWLLNQVVAWVLRWLDQNTPTQRLRDPKPQPLVKPKSGHPKYAPVDTSPGTWNRREGKWNT